MTGFIITAGAIATGIFFGIWGGLKLLPEVTKEIRRKTTYRLKQYERLELVQKDLKELSDKGWSIAFFTEVDDGYSIIWRK